MAIDLPGTGERGPPSEGAEAGGERNTGNTVVEKAREYKGEQGECGRDMGTRAIKVFFTKEI